MPNPGLLASHKPRTHGKAFLNLIESGDWRLANDPARPKIENGWCAIRLFHIALIHFRGGSNDSSKAVYWYVLELARR
jgi:hypothetical protein